MQVKAKVTIKHHPFYLDEGDTKNVPDDIGEMMVANGWAENTATGESNELSNTPVTLDIDDSLLGVTSTEV